jgi:voltage-gated potassium channel
VDIQKRFRLAATLIGVLLFAGSIGFRVLEGWTWFDGLYMTLITMTTVGYGEVHELSEAGKVFNAFLIIASFMAGGFLLVTFTQTMLEFELGKLLGRRRMERELNKMKNHYIICGAGRVGRTVASEFRSSNIPCVIIEVDGERADWAEKEEIPVVIGSGTTEDILTLARIEHAAGLVAAVTSDADNLYIVLTARGMREDLKIIARASEESAIPKLKRAGATEVVSPYHFVGHRIAQLFLHPHVIDFVDTAFGNSDIDLKIEEVEVDGQSVLAGKTLANCNVRQRTGVMVLALKKANGILKFNPPPDSVIERGDFLIVVGGSEHLQKLDTMLSA